MAKDANLNEAEEPRAVSPEELAPAAATSTVTEAAPRKATNRRGIIIGSTIAGGVLALGIGFGGGYAVAQTQHNRPDFAQMRQGQMGGQFGGFGDGDGDHGMGGSNGYGTQGGMQGQGQMRQNRQNQSGQTQQNQSGQTQQNQSGSSSNGTNSTTP